MRIKDRVYGEMEIDQPVVLDLINSKTMQRLKEVDQVGYNEPFLPNTAHSRFEHSLGDYWLLHQYGAPLEEQVAGLIHDVSHSAFSHCADYVFAGASGKNQDYQDNIFENFVRKSEIPAIIKKYQLDLDYILDDHNFPLKEKDLPDLCSDRIDYSLRTACAYGIIPDGSVHLKNLLAEKGRWIFKDLASAESYMNLFRKLNADYYSSFLAAVMMRSVGDYLRYALEQKYISEEDMFTTDKVVLDKVALHLKDDAHLSLLFERMNNRVGYKNDPEDFESKVFMKSRLVNPLCYHRGAVQRVSEIKTEWDEIIREESKPKEYFIKFER